MPDFGGARVALLEARLSEETARIVRRLGGEPVCAPALREVVVPIPALADDVVRLGEAVDPVVVCLTGVGVHALFAQATEQGCEAALVRALARATMVCRGPKPSGALARYQLTPTVRTAAPYTTHELIEAMWPLRLEGRLAAVLHYGERNAALTEWLRSRGAGVCELLPYEWRLPEDTTPLSRLIEEILDGQVDAVAFTSQVQIRHLCEVAGPARVAPLRLALNRCDVIGAIGPTCEGALQAAGVPPTVVASPPKLGTLLVAMAEAVERARGLPEAST